MKTKIKQLACVVVAFAASFMLTVTAFADFIIQNKNFKGTYVRDQTSYTNSCIVVTDDHFELSAYIDQNHKCCFSGISYEGKLSNSPPKEQQFYALFPQVTKVKLDGTPDTSSSSPTIYNYQAYGSIYIDYGIFGTIKEIRIRSAQSIFEYVK